MSRVRAGSSALLLVVAVAGCDFIMDPPLPLEAEPFNPPAVYKTWWSMTEACSGRSASFEMIEWFVIPEANSFDLAGEPAGGAWFRRRNAIVIASDGMLEGSFVRHEMLHALLGRGGHPRAEFLSRCAGIVDCGYECVRDSGAQPTVAASVPRVKPSFLDLAVSVQPAAPRVSVLNGYFSVTVRVRNPASHPVLVDLPPPDDAGPPASFSYRLFGPRGGFFASERAWDIAVRAFNAGETKLMVYDFFAGGEIRDGRLPLGAYSLRVAYGMHWSPEMSVTLDH